MLSNVWKKDRDFCIVGYHKSERFTPENGISNAEEIHNYNDRLLLNIQPHDQLTFSGGGVLPMIVSL